MRQWISDCEEQTAAIGRGLAERLVPDGVLLLEGDLGAGKTVVVRGLAEGLGVPPAEVQSPTFTLVRDHQGESSRLLHFDLYRLTPAEVAASGFEELMLGPGVKAVEWSERLPFELPGALRLRIQRDGERRRLELQESSGAGKA